MKNLLMLTAVLCAGLVIGCKGGGGDGTYTDTSDPVNGTLGKFVSEKTIGMDDLWGSKGYGECHDQDQKDGKIDKRVKTGMTLQRALSFKEGSFSFDGNSTEYVTSVDDKSLTYKTTYAGTFNLQQTTKCEVPDGTDTSSLSCTTKNETPLPAGADSSDCQWNSKDDSSQTAESGTFTTKDGKSVKAFRYIRKMTGTWNCKSANSKQDVSRVEVTIYSHDLPLLQRTGCGAGSVYYGSATKLPSGTAVSFGKQEYLSW